MKQLAKSPVELGSAVKRTSEDAWVEVNGVTVKFFSKYEDYAFTDAGKYANYLNSNPEEKLRVYNAAVEKLNEQK